MRWLLLLGLLAGCEADLDNLGFPEHINNVDESDKGPLAIDACLVGSFLNSSDSGSQYGNYYDLENLPEEEWRNQDPQIKDLWKIIEKTRTLYSHEESFRNAAKFDLDITPITWEDTGRYKNSSVGPNISDMTIQLRVLDPRVDEHRVVAMPIIRHPNFSDETTDIDPTLFGLFVGNEKGEDLKKISLYDFLENPTAFLSNPGSWKSDIKSLLAERDSKVLVSAQAAFLPIPEEDKVSFNPVLFNYQSYKENPAVLTILATKEGSSVTVIDNVRDAWSDGAIWGQRLFFNANGERASLSAKRLEKTPGSGSSSATEPSADVVLLIQIPLKQRSSEPTSIDYNCDAAPVQADSGVSEVASAGVGRADIGHAEVEGKFTEIDDLKIERDPRFPVRVTVQFYKFTDSGEISEAEMKKISDEIGEVYKVGGFAGSLVTGEETGRVTEYYGSKVQPEDWWEEFWKRYEDNTGESRQKAKEKLSDAIGKDYREKAVSNLYLRQILQ